MKALQAILFSVLPLCSFPLPFLGCGASAPAVTRQLLSVTITPATSTAQGTSGQVQFVATGAYNTPPFTVTPLQATWGIQTFPQQIASTTQDGLATCNQGASGTTTVEAWVQVEPFVCNIIDSAGRPGCGNVGGSAQLTCP